MTQQELLDKARRVIESCRTLEQAEGAMRYLELLSEQYPALDGVFELRKELITLFELKQPRSFEFAYTE